MIKKKAAYTVSMVNRLTLWTLFLGLIALLALSISTRIANDTKGSANMINQLGLLRMKNYQLLSRVPLTADDLPHLNLFSHNRMLRDYQTLLDRYDLLPSFHQLQTEWQTVIAARLQHAEQIAEVRSLIDNYVAKIDALVQAIDHKTERQLVTISRLQRIFIAIIGLFLLIQFIYLRHDLLKPWTYLISMAESITHHDFSHRFPIKRSKKNEFDLLGLAFNRMSEQIESQYLRLEQHVLEKTTELQQKNKIVTFLYDALRRLNAPLPLCERLCLILLELQKLAPLTRIHLTLYESDEHDNLTSQAYCLNHNCAVCLRAHPPLTGQSKRRFWRLQNGPTQYGVISAAESTQTPLNDEQETLIDTLIEQMVIRLTLERNIEQQKSYLLMKERSAMARELHDSIAQSLSALKIHISCLQMQGDLVQTESRELLQTMRKEINVAYSQLRELITTFRLQVNQTGFYASLNDLIEEFNQKLGITIALHYQLPLQLIESQYAIHLLQIIREALNNIYKHAQATEVTLSLTIEQDDIINVTIEDNGIGLPENWKKSDHYGLIIMQDRAEILQGYLTVTSQPLQGTRLSVRFRFHNAQGQLAAPNDDKPLAEV